MKPNKSHPEPRPWTDPALEARIVASVLGETSPFEADELERLLAKNPELALFKRRIENAHALATEACRPQEPKLRLPEDRREKLLETLRGTPASPPRVVAFPRPFWRAPQFLSRLAACAILAALVVFSSIQVLQQPSHSPPSFEGESGTLLPDSPSQTLRMADEESQRVLPTVTISPVVTVTSTVTVSPVVPVPPPSQSFAAAPVASLARSADFSAPTTVTVSPATAPVEAAKSKRDSEMSSLTASQIKAFSTGWGKGVGTGRKAESDASALAKDKAVRQRGAQGEEISAVEQPVSTFSLHVSDVSFQLAQAALAKGAIPDPERIRPEEFYNAFDYNDPAPGPQEEVACRIEQAAHPFLQQRDLVRIAVKTAATGRAAGQPLRLTLLLDTSGSMEREDRAATVTRALERLAPLLGPDDRVTLIGFARTPRLLADQVPGDQAATLVDLARNTPSEGGTNLEAALALASELALKQKQPGAQNRIVLLTDGAANLGDADAGRLAAQVETIRQQGLSFDACGVGANGLNDEILEALTRKGDGRYALLNTPEDADAGFATQLAGSFRPAAENVKVQVVFNPARVGRYRLIGFDNHRLQKEDFRNDAVQAAELSAEEAGVALYQVEPLPEGHGELGKVSVRFRQSATGRMVERTWTIPYEAKPTAFADAAPSLQLAASAALLAERLQGNTEIDLEALAPVARSQRTHFPEQPRVKEFLEMFERAQR